MPGFVSHMVMANDVYKRINNNNVSLKYMRTFSLGGDLCKYAKCRYDSHHIDQDKFIYYLADYIKKNNLVNDKEIMGVLYGHICHYVMDDIVHPLVRKMAKVCIKDKNNHTLIEEYYDSYLVNLRYGVIKREYFKNNKLDGRVNRKINKMLDNVYLTVYNTGRVGRYYKFNLILYRLLRYGYLIVNKRLMNKIIGIDKFLDNNKDIDLYNNNYLINYRDYLGYSCHDSLIDLYNVSIDVSVEYINSINKYLDI